MKVIGEILSWSCSGVTTYAKVIGNMPCGCVRLQTCLEDGTKYPYYEVDDNIWDPRTDELCVHGTKLEE